MRMGIDVGGTFTDFVYISKEKEMKYSKVLTTYPPEEGVRSGLSELRVSLKDFNFISHSTTLGLNALVTKRGAKTALITTKGFRDVLEIGRTRRLYLYDLFQDKPEELLVPRYLRFEVDERVDRYGKVLKPLDLSEVRRVVQKVKDVGVEALAISLIHSYANPKHEEAIRDIALEELPGVFVSVSSNVLPEYKEYERTYATALNAYIGPIMLQYFETTNKIFSEAGYKAKTFISQSNGGLMSTEIAMKKPVLGLGAGLLQSSGSTGPVHTVGSGPASGVMGGIFIGKLAGLSDLVCMDMGGTTCLCSLVSSGQARIISESTLGNRLKLPMIDVRSIGAGGGSIGWIDPQGALHVGPLSAAASPGPACYGFGGTEPTVTDANLHLGLLDEEFYLGGRMKVFPQKSKEALSKLGKELDYDATETAAGITRIVESNMVNNISEVSVWRGFDPGDLALIAYGGGAGLHCVRMAAELGIRTVVSPLYPAIVSALGHVVSDIKHYFSRSYLKELSEEFRPINDWYESETHEASEMIAAELGSEAQVQTFRALEMRYSGQTHEIRVDIPNRGLGPEDRGLLARRFNSKHKVLYGYDLPQYQVEVVTLLLEVVGSSRRVTLRKRQKLGSTPSRKALRKRRKTYLAEDGKFSSVDCYSREHLEFGNKLRGPSLVEGTESSVLIPEGWVASVDGYSNLVISRD